MPLNLIDHYAVRTENLEPTGDFYMDVLGFSKGDRPPFPFPGIWLYQDGKPIVHLIGISTDQDHAFSDYMGRKHFSAELGSGAVDHIAFSATGLAAMLKNLKQREVTFHENTVPGLNLHQVFVVDPNGITIEMNFPASE